MEPENDDNNLVPVFIPTLVALLVHAEDQKESPLTKDEVLALRDKATCIMMEVADARMMNEKRGYNDIDPENCWHDWQLARRDMGRRPDLDPGPRFDQVRSSDPDYQQTILDARHFISRFREMLPADGTRRPEALIKTKLCDGENTAFMWLNNTAISGDAFTAELFEVPDTLPSHKIGMRYTVTLDELLDWMVNDNGRLSGGFSLRYHRERLADDEKLEYDEFIGVSVYL